jgi:pimeloyl-ACP methyl ester carboxylesterase
MRDVLVTVVNESYESQLAQIQAPVVLLWGEDDTATPPAIAERALACLQGDATLRVVSNVGHDLHLEKPLVVESVVVHMLEAGSS